MVFALFNLVPALFFTAFHAQMASLGIVLTGVALRWSAYAMGMVFVFSIAMDQVRHCREGTDFTLQIVIVHLASLILAVASGKIAGGFSYHTLFVSSIALGMINLLAVRYRFAVMDRTSETQNTQ